MVTIEITTTSTTEYDGDFEWIITDLLDGRFRVEVAHHGVWFGKAIATSYTHAQRTAGFFMGQHMRAEEMAAGR
ncbi:hypothetical protein KAYACHO_83 [Mycobacterium phage KayaCho]|uniref:hypothetical protein n=1 Tax=Mycobacterium phage KayaCho TaxID=1340830 RepID=UPI000387F196|nr:hypothetical protein N846_gp83 [Mycobacterium phage KayaCho]AGT12987.1 hypothetical protein KAYACHO_83 [Mycobacterium phage KayaCho]